MKNLAVLESKVEKGVEARIGKVGYRQQKRKKGEGGPQPKNGLFAYRLVVYSAWEGGAAEDADQQKGQMAYHIVQICAGKQASRTEQG
jgi:hypothetical protein